MLNTRDWQEIFKVIRSERPGQDLITSTVISADKDKRTIRVADLQGAEITIFGFEYEVIDTLNVERAVLSCKLRLTVDQAVALGTWEKLEVNSIVYDLPGGMADTANNQIVIPEDGVYALTGQIAYEATSPDGIFFGGLEKTTSGNSPSVTEPQLNHSSMERIIDGHIQRSTFGVTEPCNKDDKIAVYTWTDLAHSLFENTNWGNFVMATFISPLIADAGKQYIRRIQPAMPNVGDRVLILLPGGSRTAPKCIGVDLRRGITHGQYQSEQTSGQGGELSGV